jgi:hypothetical protein
VGEVEIIENEIGGSMNVEYPEQREIHGIARTIRELHAAMDRAILACYGWEDLNPGHDFYQNDRGQTRYTLSPEARREVLARLVELNLEIAAREK